MIYTSLVCKWA